MAVVTYEEFAYRSMKILPDSESVPFVAKIQQAKTRKNKDYFVLRTTLPKDVAEKIGAKAGDYLFFKVKKAQWYHMVNWETMENTWKLLPDDFRNRIALDGLHNQRIPNQPCSLGATNVTAPLVQMPNMQRAQTGELLWK